MTRKTKVFISYAHSDLNFVQRLVEDLQQNDPGLEIWYDESLRVDDDWERELRKQMNYSDHCIVVLSENVYGKGSFRSKWVEREIEWALSCEAGLRRGIPFRIFPIRLDGCKIPPQLEGRQCADFRDYQKGLNQLIYRLLSLEKYRTLFVDRRKELDQCLKIFSLDTCHARIIYHKRRQKQMGSTFLLRALEDRIPVKVSNPPVPIFFEPKRVVNPEGWLYILDHTVQRVGEEHFQTYLCMQERMQERLLSDIGLAQRPAPESAHDIQPVMDARGIELYGRRCPPLTGQHSSSRAATLSILNLLKEISDTLTKTFLEDLERAPIPGVAWLIDGPPRPRWMGVEGVDKTMHDWLTDILRKAAAGQLPKLWVIMAGQYSPISPDQAPVEDEDFFCPLGEFDREAVEEYLDRRLPTSDTRYRAMVAIAVLKQTRHPKEVCNLIEKLIQEAALE